MIPYLLSKMPQCMTGIRHCLHGRGFMSNRIGYNAVTPLVLHGAGRLRYENRVIQHTLLKVDAFSKRQGISRSCKRRNRIAYGIHGLAGDWLSTRSKYG